MFLLTHRIWCSVIDRVPKWKWSMIYLVFFPGSGLKSRSPNVPKHVKVYLVHCTYVTNSIKTSLHRAVNLVSPAHLDLTLWAESGGTQTDRLSVLGMLLWTSSLKACVLSVFLWFQHVEARYIAARIHLMNAFLNKKSRWKKKQSSPVGSLRLGPRTFHPHLARVSVVPAHFLSQAWTCPST